MANENKPFTHIILPAQQVVTRRERDVNQTGTRRDTYEFNVKKLIKTGERPLMFPGEVIQFLLDKQGIDVEVFNKKLGYAPTYFQTNVFNSGANDGTHHLSRPMREKMAKLTKTEPEFWDERNFNPEVALNLTINMRAHLHSHKNGTGNGHAR